MTQPPPPEPSEWRPPDPGSPFGQIPAQPPPPGQGWGHGHGYGDDQLVTAYGIGFGGWFNRTMAALRRSWSPMLVIMLITQALPGIVGGLVLLPYGAYQQPGSVRPGDPPPVPDVGDLGSLLGMTFLVVVISGLLGAVGWGASTWVITRQAAGEPVTVGDALRYGARRCLGLWGWSLLVGVMVVAGICACVLPGVYFLFVFTLFVPVYLFERSNPVGRSFRILHGAPGRVAGRAATILAVVIGGSLVISALTGAVGRIVGLNPGEVSAGGVIFTVVNGLLGLPVYLFYLVGAVLAYAEQRAYEGPVSAGQLARELD